MTLAVTMETMHAAGRRSLPPVPRRSAEPTVAPAGRPDADGHEAEATTERFVVELATGEQDPAGAVDGPEDDSAASAASAASADAAGLGDAAAVPARCDAPSVAGPGIDPAQQFVAGLRAAAGDFAGAAGAESAVVREAVPPARHRRARCRLVLRYAEGAEVDVTFLGSAGRLDRPAEDGFDRQIRRWLGSGLRREDAWLVADADACDGSAVDLSAWVAAA